jgi:HAD superfamily hydrolase (TIGR01509 family)
MDGVVIDSYPVSVSLLRAHARRFGVQLSEEDVRLRNGLSGRQFWGDLKERFGLPEPVEVYLESYDVEEEIRRYTDLTPVDGVVELMKDLCAHGVRLALATSGRGKRMHAVLDLFGLRDLLAVTVCVEDVNHPKPDPEIFRVAAKGLGVDPSACLVIEDSDHGVEAAKRAGMRCIGYRGLPHGTSDLSGADRILTDFTECDVDALAKDFAEGFPDRGAR